MSPASESIDQLAPAIVAAQAEMPTVPKDSENPFFHSKYADLADVMKVAKPILAKNGLAVCQFPSHDGEQNTLATWLIHSSGQYITDDMLLMLPKDDPQGQGSAITYAKRYAYQAAVGIVADDDDDGNAAANASSPSRPARGRSGPPPCVVCGESMAGSKAIPNGSGVAHEACVKSDTARDEEPF